MIQRLAIALVLVSPLGVADDASTITSVKPIIMEFGQALKSELKAAISAGGPLAGIAVCNAQAGGITEASSKLGWEVSRTSLKWRNESNSPTHWEAQQLESFEAKLKSGVNPQKLWAVYEDEKEIRVMKAIMTDKVCLACHGENLNEEVSQTLKEFYPNDRATGFKAGQLRGAFSLKKIKL